MWRSCTLTDKETLIPELIQDQLAGRLVLSGKATCAAMKDRPHCFA